jgi:hypothetical protein
MEKKLSWKVAVGVFTVSFLRYLSDYY